jgi:N-acetylglucosaminyldiphosphoundecaprenol N-acetyl-beta-D-mannosaminyltransferase
VSAKHVAIVSASTAEIIEGNVLHCLRSLRPQVAVLVFVWRRSSDDGQIPSEISELIDRVVSVGSVGVSKARNAGLRELDQLRLLDDEHLVSFPDDDCTYPPDLVARLNWRGEGIICVPYGPSQHEVDRSRFPERCVRLTALDAPSLVASAGLFIKASLLQASRFDESLGVGTPSCAGEEIDLVLRLMSSGVVVEYRGAPVVLHAYGASRAERLRGGVAALRLNANSFPVLYWLIARRLLTSTARAMVRRETLPLKSAWAGFRHVRDESFNLAAGSFADLGSIKRDIGGGLLLSMENPHALAKRIADLYPSNVRPIVLVAAHVTTVNSHRDARFLASFNAASGAYVDGVSVKFLAKFAGYSVEKLATTDFAPEVVELMAQNLGRSVRVAVLGGEPGIARRAGARLQRDLSVDVVFTEHGYVSDWRERLADLRATVPDVVIVGLGMPSEAIWCEEYADQLPPCVVVTCGGWLRLLAGEESRSPMILQRLQLEWLYRIATDPHRTARRYLLGAGTLAQLCFRTALRRAFG